MMATSSRFALRLALGVLLGSLVLQAGAAELPATPASKDIGLMTFPNVRVINAPAAASTAKPSTSDAGMRAYKDPVSGKLREATPEDAQQLSTAAARTRARTATLSGPASASSTESVERLIYGPDNAVGLMLEDESMVFQVARKDANGKLTRECITGENSAEHALHSHQHAQENSNER
jgi:hypothetical protein